MKKSNAKNSFAVFVNSKSLLTAAFLVTMICILGYFNSPSYANSASPVQWQTIQMRVTAYCPCPKCCGDYSDGITANGHKIRQGDFFVAADKVYPFGTEMIIPGYNSTETVKVLDRGGAIYENRLDVFFPSHQQALNWGVRYLNVKIRQ